MNFIDTAVKDAFIIDIEKKIDDRGFDNDGNTSEFSPKIKIGAPLGLDELLLCHVTVA